MVYVYIDLYPYGGGGGSEEKYKQKLGSRKYIFCQQYTLDGFEFGWYTQTTQTQPFWLSGSNNFNIYTQQLV